MHTQKICTHRYTNTFQVFCLLMENMLSHLCLCRLWWLDDDWICGTCDMLLQTSPDFSFNSVLLELLYQLLAQLQLPYRTLGCSVLRQACVQATLFFKIVSIDLCTILSGPLPICSQDVDGHITLCVASAPDNVIKPVTSWLIIASVLMQLVLQSISV